jgi:hypothetical protein
LLLRFGRQLHLAGSTCPGLAKRPHPGATSSIRRGPQRAMRVVRTRPLRKVSEARDQSSAQSALGDANRLTGTGSVISPSRCPEEGIMRLGGSDDGNRSPRCATVLGHCGGTCRSAATTNRLLPAVRRVRHRPPRCRPAADPIHRTRQVSPSECRLTCSWSPGSLCSALPTACRAGRKVLSAAERCSCAAHSLAARWTSRPTRPVARSSP